MSTALRVLRPVAPPGVIRLAAADVACDVQQAPTDARDTSSAYELALANGAPVSVSCRLYGVDEHVRSRDFGMLEVASKSLGRARFAVPCDTRNRYERVFVEVIGDGIRLLAEVQTRPPRAARRAWMLPLLFLLGAFVATLGAFAAWASPAIVALGVPHAAPPGFVTVSYAVRGRAATSYRAATSQGVVLASGVLPAASGNLAFVVPDGAAGQRVDVTLDARGPLGHASRSAAFDVGVAARPYESPAAQIRALTAHRETYAGKTSVLASYSAIGDGGSLRVLDARGALLGSAPFTHVGTSRISLDRDTSGEALRAELVVSRGASRADAAVELPTDGTDNELTARASAMAVAVAAEASKLSAGSSSGTAVPDIVDGAGGVAGSRGAQGSGAQSGVAESGVAAGNSAAAAGDSASAASLSDPFHVIGRVTAGQPISVAIRHQLPQMHIALQDDTGTTLQERAVAAGVTEMRFAVPAATAGQTYYLACTFMRGTSEETLVRSLRIAPR